MGEGEEIDTIISGFLFDTWMKFSVLKAEVSASANAEEANRPDCVLNKYDYFGYGNLFPIMIFFILII